MSFETKCRALHESFVDIAKQKPDMGKEEFLDIATKITENVRRNTPGYQSVTPQGLINSLLQNIKYITTSTAGSKIKIFARII